MLPKFRFYNIKLNNTFDVINIDLYNEQVDCVLEERYADVITWDIKDGVLMQSTRAKDVNGKEIYEGDVVKNSYGETGCIKHLVYTFVSDKKKKRKWKGNRLRRRAAGSPLEIIGNIHEHSHLLDDGGQRQ